MMTDVVRMPKTIDDFFVEQVVWMRKRVEPRGLSVVEWGAQRGKHSLAFLDAGARSALAVEGRQVNIDQAVNTYPDRLRFLCADVRQPPGEQERGMYDIGLALGILYHLDRPAKFLSSHLPMVIQHLFIWTHLVPETRNSLDGYGGRFWQDPGQTESCALEPLRAFWLTEYELTRCLFDNGFRVVEIEAMPTPVNPQYGGAMVYAKRMRPQISQMAQMESVHAA